LIISARIPLLDEKDEKKGIKISSAACSAFKPQGDEKPFRSGPSLPAYLFSKPKYLQMF
jgi:hypothetical protein